MLRLQDGHVWDHSRAGIALLAGDTVGTVDTVGTGSCPSSGIRRHHSVLFSGWQKCVCGSWLPGLAGFSVASLPIVFKGIAWEGGPRGSGTVPRAGTEA